MLPVSSSASRLQTQLVTARASTPIPSVNLQPGDKGPAVKQLQDALVKLGHMTAKEVATGPGIFGPRTTAAVKEFQAKHGVPTTGNYGPLTRAAMRQALDKIDGPRPPAPPPAPGTLTKPPVISAPSPNKNSRNGTDIDTIVLHHTASNNGAGDLAHMRNPASQVSAHYMVDRDGKIYQLVKDGERAWHAGKSALHGVPTDVNSRSIGIEIVNDGGGKTPYTEAQYRALEKLVPWLAKTYKVPLRNLVGHKDVAIPKGRKSDPSENFDFARIRRATDRVV